MSRKHCHIQLTKEQIEQIKGFFQNGSGILDEVVILGSKELKGLLPKDLKILVGLEKAISDLGKEEGATPKLQCGESTRASTEIPGFTSEEFMVSCFTCMAAK